MTTEQLVSLPTGADVIGFLGWSTDSEVESQAAVHVDHVIRAARGYTRGRGFSKDSENVWTVAEDIAAVVVSAAARSLNNPTADVRVEAGSFNSVPGSFSSFSLVETSVLNRYRRRAS